MVILQFNKLIRNKWVWGVFALVVSALFCLPDDLFSGKNSREPGDGEPGAGEAGILDGSRVDAKRFRVIAEEVRGIGHGRDWKMPAGEANRKAWENYALLEVAARNGITATDSAVTSMIQREPAFQDEKQNFNFDRYVAVLADISMTPEQFEAYTERQVTMSLLGNSVLGTAVWCPAMEVDQSLADMTDEFTVRVASFEQTAKDAAAVKVDDQGVKKWYDENAKSLELPERVRVRYAKFNVTDAKILAKMSVTEDQIHDHYDATIDKYTTTDTNGVDVVKEFDAVRGAVEAELRQIEAVAFYETNLISRAYEERKDKPAKGTSRLDQIAAEEGVKVQLSDWFSVEGGTQEGFMKDVHRIAPGMRAFAEVVAGLDAEIEDQRYGVAASDSEVWLIEKAETSPKHVPTFEEAKNAIRPRVIRDAQAAAFKASVEAVAKKGAEAVLAGKNVSTNLAFRVHKLYRGEADGIPDAFAVARAAHGLAKGELSEFTLTGTGRAILVYCVDRKEGDLAERMALSSMVRDDQSRPQLAQLADEWKKWNLARLGFTPGKINGVASADAETEE